MLEHTGQTLFFQRASVLSRESKSLVAAAFGMPCASAYSRTALRVWRPMAPSMAPGLKPAALSLPCSSRISSGVNGAGLGCAVDGICNAGEATGRGPVEGETGGGEAVRGEAGGAETSAAAAGGVE